MSERFELYRRNFTDADLETFEALCFHHARTVVAPYLRLLNAPRIRDQAVAQALVESAYEDSAPVIDNVYAAGTGSGALVFAYALGTLCEGPGRIPTLISVKGPDPEGKFDWCVSAAAQ